MYLFNENTLYENIVNMGKAFHRYYGNTYAAYSFKTNYLADICQIVNEAGLLAEVVSPYERMYAMELGFTPDRIVYNGVIPNTAERSSWPPAAASSMLTTTMSCGTSTSWPRNRTSPFLSASALRSMPGMT